MEQRRINSSVPEPVSAQRNILSAQSRLKDLDRELPKRLLDHPPSELLSRNMKGGDDGQWGLRFGVREESTSRKRSLEAYTLPGAKQASTLSGVKNSEHAVELNGAGTHYRRHHHSGGGEASDTLLVLKHPCMHKGYAAPYKRAHVRTN